MKILIRKFNILTMLKEIITLFNIYLTQKSKKLYKKFLIKLSILKKIIIN